MLPGGPCSERQGTSLGWSQDLGSRRPARFYWRFGSAPRAGRIRTLQTPCLQADDPRAGPWGAPGRRPVAGAEAVEAKLRVAAPRRAAGPRAAAQAPALTPRQRTARSVRRARPEL